MKKYFVFSIIVFSITSANAQQHSHNPSEARNEIRALTSEQINGYLNGEGMGLAKAAELNHYFGPKHVFDLANELNMTRSQIDSTEKIVSSLKEEAIRIGKIIIEKEELLDQLFNKGNADEKSVRKLVNEITKYKGELRFVHIEAHIKQKEILTADQINIYDELRGYNITDQQ